MAGPDEPEHERYAEAIVQTVRHPLLVLDSGLRVRLANPAFYRTFHLTPAETLGRLIYDLGDGQGDIATLRAVLEQALTGEQEPADVELHHEFPTIGRRTMLLQARKIDHLPLVLLAIEDIPERKQIELAVREREEALTMAQQGARTAWWGVDLESGHGIRNPIWLELMGLEPDEEPPDFAEHLMMIHPEDRDRVMAGFQLAAQGGPQEHELEYRVMHPQRGERWMLARGRYLPPRNGRGPRLHGIVMDITERKRAEEKLHQSERLYRTLAANLPQGAAFVLDRDLRFRLADGVALHATGLHPEDLEGKTIWEALDPETAILCEQHYRQGLAGEAFVFEHCSRDRHFISHGVPLRHENGEVYAVLSVAYDITVRKRLEEELRQLNASLEKQVSERTTLAEQRATQLRRLTQQLTRAEQEERQRLAQILHDHVQQLLVAAKMRVGTLVGEEAEERARQKVQAISEILNDAINATRTLAVELAPPVLHERGLAPALEWLARRVKEQHQLQVEVTADPQAEPGLPALRDLMFQAARELLLNVIKHAQVDRAELHLSRRQEYAELEVCDQGVGFDAAATWDDPDSFGLIHIRERLEPIGGSIEVESRPGDGSRVTVLVPIAPAPSPEDEAPAPAHIGPHPKADGSRIRVLLADDHPLIRQGLTGLLELQDDLEVVGEAEDGVRAVELARRLQPDVVVMDMNMPNMNGLEATRRIAAEAPHIRIIALSLHGEKDMAQAMLDAGAEQYVPKDAPSQKLLEAIRTPATRQSG